ncbi:MAG: Inner membrane protein YbaN [candidate division WS2 bacterium]|uniref:Inner membrane protein YbaN n=1 Tax=Psychracetigena formicireducens TaxID=2986056 RepID=A0A9E2F5U2_PSYF1|nr:Inner membrane protein YbaN [Candidatus Psychracetigena formicireducens]MBT9150429.1 Inner membrane protein YbaN [Candidatus Psychracetigena formicireducens]
MTDSRPRKQKINSLFKILLIIAGTISLLLGIIGIFIPLLPTTPLLLLSAWCYLRSSEKLYLWLMQNRIFGRYILNYQEGKGAPLYFKTFTLIILWGTIIYTAFFVLNHSLLRWLLLIIAISVTVHIYLIPTSRDK